MTRPVSGNSSRRCSKGEERRRECAPRWTLDTEEALLFGEARGGTARRRCLPVRLVDGRVDSVTGLAEGHGRAIGQGRHVALREERLLDGCDVLRPRRQRRVAEVL